MKADKIQMVKVEDFNRTRVETPLCDRHNRQMIQKGKSKRGFPLFYCIDGYVIEKGSSRVKVVFEDKGYGFINLPKGKDDLFFHVTNISDHSGNIQKGDKVEFTVGVNPKKQMLQALDVRKVKERDNGRY